MVCLRRTGADEVAHRVYEQRPFARTLGGDESGVKRVVRGDFTTALFVDLPSGAAFAGTCKRMANVWRAVQCEQLLAAAQAIGRGRQIRALVDAFCYRSSTDLELKYEDGSHDRPPGLSTQLRMAKSRPRPTSSMLVTTADKRYLDLDETVERIETRVQLVPLPASFTNIECVLYACENAHYFVLHRSDQYFVGAMLSDKWRAQRGWPLTEWGAMTALIGREGYTWDPLYYQDSAASTANDQILRPHDFVETLRGLEPAINANGLRYKMPFIRVEVTQVWSGFDSEASYISNARRLISQLQITINPQRCALPTALFRAELLRQSVPELVIESAQRRIAEEAAMEVYRSTDSIALWETFVATFVNAFFRPMAVKRLADDKYRTLDGVVAHNMTRLHEPALTLPGRQVCFVKLSPYGIISASDALLQTWCYSNNMGRAMVDATLEERLWWHHNKLCETTAWMAYAVVMQRRQEMWHWNAETQTRVAQVYHQQRVSIRTPEGSALAHFLQKLSDTKRHESDCRRRAMRESTRVKRILLAPPVIGELDARRIRNGLPLLCLVVAEAFEPGVKLGVMTRLHGTPTFPLVIPRCESDTIYILQQRSAWHGVRNDLRTMPFMQFEPAEDDAEHLWIVWAPASFGPLPPRQRTGVDDDDDDDEQNKSYNRRLTSSRTLCTAYGDMLIDDILEYARLSCAAGSMMDARSLFQTLQQRMFLLLGEMSASAELRDRVFKLKSECEHCDEGRRNVVVHDFNDDHDEDYEEGDEYYYEEEEGTADVGAKRKRK